MDDADVLVVGAGPAGCMLAGEVALAGRSVVVLEKRAAISPLSRAFGVHARTLEVLDTRGLAEPLIGTGTAAPALSLWRGAGLDLTRLPSRYPFVLVTPQVNVDTLVEKHARDNGAQIVRGAEVTGLEQHEDGVVVRARTEAGERSWKAAYVVGADGAHSAVRDLVGAAFPGKVVLKTIMLADVHLADPPAGVVSVNAVEDCFAFLAPFGDGWFRVIAWDRANETAEGAETFRAEAGMVGDIMRRAFGTDHGMGEVRWVSQFRSDERQVAAYRTGRVFLAGDAAHVHSPAGGQGMNTGIQDAANLGWKLAAVLDGADPAVLDTYQAERHPVGRLVLRSSGATIRLMTLRSPLARLLRARAVPRLLGIRKVADKTAGLVTGVAIRYPRRRGQHPLVGTRLHDLPGLPEAMRRGGFVLVLERGAPDPATTTTMLRRTDDGPGLLVRPDGYVAWAGATASGEWAGELDRWTGGR